jgi:hypothetical protein
MARGTESFERRQRERAKKAKADAKRELRQSRGSATPAADEPPERTEADEGAILAELAQLHASFEDEAISLEEFEERREALLAQLHVD